MIITCPYCAKNIKVEDAELREVVLKKHLSQAGSRTSARKRETSIINSFRHKTKAKNRKLQGPPARIIDADTGEEIITLPLVRAEKAFDKIREFRRLRMVYKLNGKEIVQDSYQAPDQKCRVTETLAADTVQH